MRLATAFGQPDLFLAFGKAGCALGVLIMLTVMTTDAFDIFGALHVILR